MKLKLQVGVSLVAFTFAINSFAACEHEKDKLRIANDACNAAKSTGEWWTKISAIGGGIASAVTLNPIWLLAGGSAAIPGGFAWRLCDLKIEREAQLKDCEDHQAFLAKSAEEQRRLEQIAIEVKAAATEGTRLFMRRVAEFDAIINREINEMYGAYLDDGRISLDPENPTDPAILQELQEREIAIRGRYF